MIRRLCENAVMGLDLVLSGLVIQCKLGTSHPELWKHSDHCLTKTCSTNIIESSSKEMGRKAYQMKYICTVRKHTTRW